MVTASPLHMKEPVHVALGPYRAACGSWRGRHRCDRRRPGAESPELHRGGSGPCGIRCVGIDVGIPLHTPGRELVLHQPRGSASRGYPRRRPDVPGRESSGQDRPDRDPPAVSRPEEPLRYGTGTFHSVARVRVGEPPAQESASRTVLMVDDDPDVRTSVARGLRHSGFDVRVAANGKEALRLLSNESHDALVLDVQMPELDGVAVVTALRALGNDIPICVLSARDTVNDRIAGLEAGADDYLTKPFDLGELVARLHALLRRASHSDQPSDTMTVGPLTIDTARRLVFVAGERVDLTKREFDLLAVLAENAGVVLSRQRLLELVWGYDFDVDTNVADVFISYLRRKLERDGLPRVIHTVRGIGYVLRDEP